MLAAAVCFLFLMSGLEIVQAIFRGWAPEALLEAVRAVSLLTTFDTIAQGVIDLRHVILFASTIGISLLINTAVVELKKSG